MKKKLLLLTSLLAVSNITVLEATRNRQSAAKRPCPYNSDSNSNASTSSAEESDEESIVFNPGSPDDRDDVDIVVSEEIDLYNARNRFANLLRSIPEDEDSNQTNHLIAIENILLGYDSETDHNPLINMTFEHNDLEFTPLLYAIYMRNIDLLDELYPYLSSADVYQVTRDFPHAMDYVNELETSEDTDSEVVAELRDNLMAILNRDNE